MGKRQSAQNWYLGRRLKCVDGPANKKIASNIGLKTGKKGDEKLEINVFCRVLLPKCRDECEVSICADGKPKCYYVWQNILYAPVHDDCATCKPLFAPKRIIIPSKKKDDTILLGKNVYVSLYVNKKEISCSCDIDKKFNSGLEIILNEARAELSKAELLQRYMSPQNKAKLLKYFSEDFVGSIKKEYYFCTLVLKLPESMNHNNHNV